MLDTLNILQAELDVERKKNAKNLWMDIVQEVQRERDEMKEVVELLIWKGKLLTQTGQSQLLWYTHVQTLNSVLVEVRWQL